MSGFAWDALEEHHLKRFFSTFAVDCVFDVGANFGQYKRMIRDKLGFTGFIISYEPIPGVAWTLRESRKERPDDKWFIEEMALDSRAGEAEFNVMASDQFSSLKDPDHSNIAIFKDNNKINKKIVVKVDTVSEQFAKYQDALGFKRPFLKMDTQGNDTAVVEGAGECIDRFVGLQSELSFRKIYKDSVSYDEALRYYSGKGFVLSALVPNNGGHFPDLVELDCIMYHKSQGIPRLG